ncbi:branched-chain amino acid ABC transporter permease [Burkholderia contaminans]|uniref:branched-chain amino acid ABC transporter permease n=1 Tax=Burkholderia contaminans TaxID=488447 RepID=UPI002D806BE6|nr:branched-chain amino acid ABC transporter permease [Burkholderia contaminans]
MFDRYFSRARTWLSQPALNRSDVSQVMTGFAMVVAGAILPFVVGAYQLTVIRDALELAILALSYDLLWGRAGVLTLGHTTFFGIGAYGFAVTTVQFGQTPFVGFLAGLACAAVAAAVLGYFLLYAGVRLHFFAILSMAVLIIAQQLATSWQSVTGGDTGLLGIPGLSFQLAGHTLDLSGPVASWYAVATILVALLGAVWLLCRSRYGKVLAAISTNEWRALACGYHTSWHLLLMFVASAVLAAVAGCLMAATAGVVAPDVFSPVLATEVILWVAIGGRGSLGGPVLAAVGLTLLKHGASSMSTQWWPLILGAVFLACVLCLPNGVRLGGMLKGLRQFTGISLKRMPRSCAQRVEGGS